MRLEELPKAIEGPVEPKRELSLLDVDNNFNKDDRIILNNYDLMKPANLTQVPPQNYWKREENIYKSLNKLEGKKRQKKISDEDKKSYDIELQTLKKYGETITDLLSSFKYKPQSASGIYTQKKRNAYKISQRGQYGGLVIGISKL